LQPAEKPHRSGASFRATGGHTTRTRHISHRAFFPRRRSFMQVGGGFGRWGVRASFAACGACGQKACVLTTRCSGRWTSVGRVWPRHGHRGPPLNAVVRTHEKHRGRSLPQSTRHHQLPPVRGFGCGGPTIHTRAVPDAERLAVTPRELGASTGPRSSRVVVPSCKCRVVSGGGAFGHHLRHVGLRGKRHAF
jgi:hypothetical protein